MHQFALLSHAPFLNSSLELRLISCVRQAQSAALKRLIPFSSLNKLIDRDADDESVGFSVNSGM